MTVVEHIKGVLIKIFCLNKIISRLEEADTDSQFTVDCGLYPLHEQTTERNAAIQSYSFIPSSMALQIFVGPWSLFQFHNPVLSVDSLDRASAHHKATTYTQNKCTQPSMPQVGFEPMTPVFKQVKTVHAPVCVATVISNKVLYCNYGSSQEFIQHKTCVIIISEPRMK
jgi:hypothetical protein